MARRFRPLQHYLAFCLCFVAILASISCSPPESKSGAYPIVKGQVTVTSICAFLHDLSTASPKPSSSGRRSCIPLVRSVQFDYAPLPVLSDNNAELMTPELSLAGCTSSAAGPVTRLGLIPSGLPSSSSWTDEELCSYLPGTSGGLSRNPVFGSATGRDSQIRDALNKCREDASAGAGPIRGPETISMPVAEIVVGVGAGIGVDLLVDALGNLTPEERIAIGAALLLMVAPTAIAVGTIFATGTLAATITGAITAEALTVGTVMLGKGVAAKVKGPAPTAEPAPPTAQPAPPSPEPATQAPAPETAGPATVGPDPQGPASGRPDPDAEKSPESCMRALALMASCLGKRTCEDPMAAELEQIRLRACQMDKVLIDPDSTYCSGRAASPGEVSAAVISVCTKIWSDRKPDPDQPMSCPLVSGAAVAGVLVQRDCVFMAQMGNDPNCPPMGEPVTPPLNPSPPPLPGPER